MARDNVHLRSLTSLRFLAAGLVLIYHAGNWSTRDISQRYDWLQFGPLGVSFFFVLSGLVLVWSVDERDSAARFYRRRFARVWPLHALTFGFATALGIAGFIELRGSLSDGPVNLALLQAWSFDGDTVFGFNSVLWSLSAEALFYALFPIAVVAARRAGPWFTIAFGVCWLLTGGVVMEVYEQLPVGATFPPYRMGEFVVGIGLGLLARQRRLPRIGTRTSTIIALATYGGLITLNQVTDGQITPRPWLYAILALPSIALVLIAFTHRDLGGSSGWLTTKVMVRLGQWSFALYMVHELILRILHPVLVNHVWLITPAMIAVVAASGVAYECFERPVERRLRGRDRSAIQMG